jgi:hypothetical protein
MPDRPDKELATKTRARMLADKVDFATARGFVLSENPDLVARYLEFTLGVRDSSEPPDGETAPGEASGTRLVFTEHESLMHPGTTVRQGHYVKDEPPKRADIELAERIKAKIASDQVDWKTAHRLVLTEDPALGERYQALKLAAL